MARCCWSKSRCRIMRLSRADCQRFFLRREVVFSWPYLYFLLILCPIWVKLSIQFNSRVTSPRIVGCRPGASIGIWRFTGFKECFTYVVNGGSFLPKMAVPYLFLFLMVVIILFPYQWDGSDQDLLHTGHWGLPVWAFHVLAHADIESAENQQVPRCPNRAAVCTALMNYRS